MKRFLLFATLLFSVSVFADDWSFHGGYVFYDNTQTQWTDGHIMFVIGSDSWSSAYEMAPDTVAGRFTCPLPLHGWNDATYLAVISDTYVWDSGEWDANNVVNASHYTGIYTAGLSSHQGEGFLISPASPVNGCEISIASLGNGFSGVRFTTAEKNACQKLDPVNNTVTLIFSTAQSRFNQSFTAVKKIYVYGPVTMWNVNENYRLNRFSDDSCFYRTFALDEIERPGNSGRPEFRFKVYKTDGTDYEERSHASWECGIDSRLLIANRSNNMMVMLPGDQIEDLGERHDKGQIWLSLNEWGELAGDYDKQIQISNFRRVPGTANLYRSYHPYAPDEANDTEERRFHYINKFAEKVGIQSDLCLSGDQSYLEGNTYQCGDHAYQVSIPSYYARMMQQGNVLIVGTDNGHTPAYNDCLYQKHPERYGEWMHEIAAYINDENHPGPWQIHCQLGGDRTGMFAATLAALCGADWESIARDYEATTDLKMQQFRHRDLLRYAFRLMIGDSPEQVEDLQSAVRSYMVSHAYLTETAIDSMVTRLVTPINTTYTVVVPAGTNACYMSATWNNWTWTRMDSVDATHFRLTVPYVSEACEYKYSCGPSWDYEDLSTKGTANRTWHATDTVSAWKAAPDACTPMPSYGDIRLRVYSTTGIPYLRWQSSGDRCQSSAMSGHAPSAPVAMKETEEEGWYEWTWKDVDLEQGIGYTLRVANQEDSEQFVAYANECRNANYQLMECPEIPTETMDAQSIKSNVRKIWKDGMLFIVHGTHTYTLLGNKIY